jgi:defect-in-organelle-trafficking protein DotB
MTFTKTSALRKDIEDAFPLNRDMPQGFRWRNALVEREMEPIFRDDLTRPWSNEIFERLLIHLKGCGMSDLLLSPGKRPQARIDGVWREVALRTLTSANIDETLNHTTGNRAAASLVYSGLDMDYSFEVGVKPSERTRYRANAVAVSTGWGSGISLTLRLVPGAPPLIQDMKLEEGLVKELFPDSGLVLVTGVMGSGKSTFLASVMAEIARRGGRHICTYESPLEFDLGRMLGARGPCEQSEVPRHVENYGRAVRNLTRRAADVVLVGESRDQETLRGVIQAAELGLSVYTTAHTRGVSETPTRILNAFSPKERRGMRAAFFSSLRLIVQQRLLPAPGGGRRAIREYLPLDEAMRKKLLSASEDNLPLTLEAMLKDKGETLLAAARREVDKERITRESFLSILHEKGN